MSKAGTVARPQVTTYPKQIRKSEHCQDATKSSMVLILYLINTDAQDAYSKGQMATKKMQLLDQLVAELTNKNKIEVSHAKAQHRDMDNNTQIP